MIENIVEKPVDNFPEIYSTRLMFREKANGEKMVSIQMRNSKKGKSLNRKVAFPQNIKEEELGPWTWYHGEKISVYHRKKANLYVRDNVSVPTELSYKLESLVNLAYPKKNDGKIR